MEEKLTGLETCNNRTYYVLLKQTAFRAFKEGFRPLGYEVVMEIPCEVGEEVFVKVKKTRKNRKRKI